MSSTVIKRLASSHAAKVSVSQLWVSLVLLIVLIATLTIAIRLQPVAAAAPTPAKAPSVTKVVAETTTGTPTQTAPAPAPKVSPIPAPKDCTPVSGRALPTAINLSAAPNGLSQVINPATYYQIFGNSSAQIQTQLQKCAPLRQGGETFAAEASYTITWQYNTQTGSDGRCVPSNVKVGLRTDIILPSWSATASATAGLAGKWQAFIANLTHHENGHIALDNEYATQLVADLQNYPATDCGELNAQVQALASSTLARLDAANAAYDEHTDHGATQGAILP